MENFYLYLVLLLLPFLFFLIKKNFYTHYNLPPHPLTLPIIGHIHLMYLNRRQIRESPEIFFGNLLSKYPSKMVFLKLGSQPILVVSCPYTIKKCFSSNLDLAFADRPKNLASECLSYNYKVVSFVSKNQLWTDIRTFTKNELFSEKCLRGFSVLCQEENIDLLRSLAHFTTKPVNLNSWFYLLGLNHTNRMVSGERFANYDDIEKEKKRLDETREMFRPNLPIPSICDFFPILRVFPFIEKGIKNEMEKIHEKRNEHLQGIMDEFLRKKAIADQSCNTCFKEKKSTFIETLYQKQESDANFDDEMIKAHLLIMFVAGIETSALTMERVILLLLDHPEVMKRLREEIDNQVGTERFLIDEDLKTLPFLKNIVSETLRLYPPVKVILPHLATNQCKVGEFDIPEGTTLLVNVWAMQRDPKVWDEPEKFKPERFENFESLEKNLKRIRYIPFGDGIRKCPGDNMALGWILLAVGSLVHCFDIEKVGMLTRCTPRTNLAHLF
ncbi:cytochrome P450 81C13-like [Impatiens glandulifera]|uniref:cytochrome P450 81C13-like n=1 Tax=Impatiens glandulifera TaxID=253017 RepID=UPI001FB07D37|nr:cytochrome P450 81C13-like [Impatiens glandulifera]